MTCIKERIIRLAKGKGISVEDFAVNIGMTYSSFKGSAKYTPINSDAISNILTLYNDVNAEWLLIGKGNMLKQGCEPVTEKKEEKEIEETLPRIPYNIAVSSLSVILENKTIDSYEQLPIIKAFSKYDFTILAKGNSMLPEFHSGDELACLYINPSEFIQWGQLHVLDTIQGVIIKRIFDDNEYILCKSENEELYEDFRISKADVYSFSLVIGLIRQY